MDMIALLLKSLQRKKKRENKLGLVGSSQEGRKKERWQLFLPTSAVWSEGYKNFNRKKKKGLGSRTIKLWAAVCCVNQERPNSGLL